jgi:predicted nucleotidyltransferase
MKELKFNKDNKELTSYASSFVSFVLPKINVNEIILFGSVARGDYGKESDIDLFFDIINKDDEKEIKIINDELNKFYKSKIAESFILRNIKNPIKIEVGKLDEWKLKRSIISDGIVLYGKYKELPKGIEKFIYFNIKPIKNIAKRNKIIRILFGRKEENYNNEGIINKFKGSRLTPTSFLISSEYLRDIIDLFSKEKIDYSFFEVWKEKR